MHVQPDSSRPLEPSEPLVMPSVPEQALVLLGSTNEQERLEAVTLLSEISRSGDEKARELLVGCTWDPSPLVRDAAKTVLKELGDPTASDITPQERKATLIADIRSQIAAIEGVDHALERQNMIRALSHDANFFAAEFKKAISVDEKSFVELLLRVERDTRALYSPKELEDNFPMGWYQDQTAAITSLILSTPSAQEILLGVMGTELGGTYAAETLGAVYLRDYDRGKKLKTAPLRKALLGADLQAQYEALTTVLRLGDSAEKILPGVTHLLRFTTREERDAFVLEIAPEKMKTEQPSELEERIKERTDLPGEELEVRALTRGLVRSMTRQIMRELDIPEVMHDNFDIVFLPDEKMETSHGFALPYTFAVHEKFVPVLGKVIRDEELDEVELFRGLAALEVILHEGRHLAQYRLIPYDASAACAQDALKPGLRYLSPQGRSDIIDGARSSSLSWASGYDLSNRLGEGAGDAKSEALSVEKLRATFVLEVDAYSYAALNLFNYINCFPSLVKAWERYAENGAPEDEEFYGTPGATEEERKSNIRELLKIREGDEKPFSYFRRYESTQN